jgi:hypothetical protein
LLLAAFFAPIAAAQPWQQPTISLASQGAPVCDSPVEGYTCNANINVSWALPSSPTCQSPGCHDEYCLTQNGTTYQQTGTLVSCEQDMLWTNTQPTGFSLDNGNGLNYVYGEFRTVQNGQAAPSLPDTESMTASTLGSVVGLSAPNGILEWGGSIITSTPVQMQYIDYASTRPIVFAAATLNGESVTANIYACTTTTGCSSTPLNGVPIETGIPSYNFVFAWTIPSPDSASYLSVEAVDAAGTAAFNKIPGGGATPLFQFFMPPSSLNGQNTQLTCNTPGNTLGTMPGPCYLLANAGAANDADTDIPGDPLSATSTACSGNNDPIAFQGYADPSMRRDALPGDNPWLNVWGTNLYMIYSYAKFWTTTAASPQVCSDTGVVETHWPEAIPRPALRPARLGRLGAVRPTAQPTAPPRPYGPPSLTAAVLRRRRR